MSVCDEHIRTHLYIYNYGHQDTLGWKHDTKNAISPELVAQDIVTKTTFIGNAMKCEYLL